MKKLKNQLTKLSRLILSFEVYRMKQWLISDTNRYVDSVLSTKVLTDIENDHEIMSTSGDYATLPIRGGLESLYQYYKSVQ